MRGKKGAIAVSAARGVNWGRKVVTRQRISKNTPSKGAPAADCSEKERWRRQIGQKGGNVGNHS